MSLAWGNIFPSRSHSVWKTLPLQCHVVRGGTTWISSHCTIPPVDWHFAFDAYSIIIRDNNYYYEVTSAPWRFASLVPAQTWQVFAVTIIDFRNSWIKKILHDYNSCECWELRIANRDHVIALQAKSGINWSRCPFSMSVMLLSKWWDANPEARTNNLFLLNELHQKTIWERPL
jgi:hypothetical protein